MRVTVDAIKITLLVYLVHLPGRTFFVYDSLVLPRHRNFFVHRPRVTPRPFVRTEVGRLNCEFRDNYAPRGNPGANIFPTEGQVSAIAVPRRAGSFAVRLDRK